MNREAFFSRYKTDFRSGKLGDGSFGSVYKTRDTIRDEWKAIKIAPVKHIGTKEYSLEQEYGITKDLPDHQNIANYESVYTFENENGIFSYAIMQYYAEGNLKELLQSQKLNIEQKNRLASGIVNGIDFLHRNAVFHRDLKPNNILISKYQDQYTSKITDFGVSKKLIDLDMSNSGIGWTGYSSPELLKGLRLTLKADLWSVGVILYEIFHGRHPFYENDDSLGSQSQRIRVSKAIVQAPSPSDIDEIPHPFNIIVEKCLRKDPSARDENIRQYLSFPSPESVEIPPIPVTLVEDTLRRSDEVPIPKKENELIVSILSLFNSTLSGMSHAAKSMAGVATRGFSSTVSAGGYLLAAARNNLGALGSIFKKNRRKVTLLLFLLSLSGIGMKYNGQIMSYYNSLSITMPKWVTADSNLPLASIDHLTTEAAVLSFIKNNPSHILIPDANQKLEDFTTEKDGQAYSLVLDQRNTASIQAYQDDFPSGIYIEQVDSIQSLVFKEENTYSSEASLYKLIEAKEEEITCKLYLEEYPNGSHISEVRSILTKIKKAKEERLWKESEKMNSLSSLQKYLTLYPNGAYSELAISSIKKIKDKIELDFWNQVYKENEHNSYEDYLQKYPNGKYASQANKAIEKLAIEVHNQFWLKTEKENSKKAFVEYLSRYPNGAYSIEAKVAIEELDWVEAKQENSIGGYQKYISAYPNGEHKKESDSAIFTLQKSVATTTNVASENTSLVNTKEVVVESVADEVEFPTYLSSFYADIVNIPAGSFTLGCDDFDKDCQSDEKPSKQMAMSAYEMSKYEVNQSFYKSLMGSNPSYFTGCDACPVENVSWHDTQVFIKKLNEIDRSYSYRLPTEAEWEYAATANSKFKFSGGDDLDIVAINKYNNKRTQPSGQRRSNKFNVYDMSGNVSEWCSDWYDKKAYSNSNVSNGSQKVIRGGSYKDGEKYNRINNRRAMNPDDKQSFVGFRLMRKRK